LGESERGNHLRVVASLILILLTSAVIPAAAAAPTSPMSFEANEGQSEPVVKFLARGRGYGLFLTPTEAVLVLTTTRPVSRGARSVAPATDPVVVRMRLVGADPAATMTGLDPRPGVHHYLLGHADGWRRSVPAFARVQYTGVYPGVDLVFYGAERQLEYDFVIQPGADPGAVALAFEGAEGVRVDEGGDLVLATRGGELRMRRPVIYQDGDGQRRPVEGGYVLDGDRVRFQVAAWDASRPLVIDPVLGYSTYLGGSSSDEGLGIAVDGDGNAYVTGSTISTNFPVTPNAARPTRSNVTDAFVTKLSPGGALVYSTFLGGNGDDVGSAVAVDVDGNAYVAGTTNSTNFPLQGPFQSTLRGDTDGFVTKLDPTGSTLVYSTYLGSNTPDTANGIAVDGSGNAYVTGSTGSANFPNNGAVACLGTKSTGSDAFVARLEASGATVGYCRFIGGSGIDVGQGIVADAAGNTWVVGTTTSSNLGVQAAVQPAFGGSSDGFVGKLGPTGTLVYLTYLGGGGDDLALAVAVDPAGNAYVTGSTASIDFPTISPLQPILGGGLDAFVAKLNAAGSALVFATYLGGVADDTGNGIAVQPSDSSVWLAGVTESVNFPVQAPIQLGLAGLSDAFVARLNAAGSALVSSTYLGGAGTDGASATAVDADGVVYVTGATNSTAFPTASSLQGFGGLLDAFVTQIVDAGVIQFTLSSYQVNEGVGTTTITVRRTGDTSAAATVQFATSNGSATAGLDYVATNGMLTFPAGQVTATFTVSILGDALCDGDETVNLTLSNPSSGNVLGARRTAVLTIRESGSCINFSAATYSASENQGSAVVTVTRSGAATGTVTVRISTSDGTATQPADYKPVVNRVLTFGPGVRSVNTSIPLVNDALLEGPETVNLTLSNVTGPATLGVRSTAVLTIEDGDFGGVIQFSAATYTVFEGPGASATITVTRTGSALEGATVDFATSNGTATAPGDYTTTAGTLTFLAGQRSLTFNVPIANDGVAEIGETVNLALSNPGPAGTTTLGTRRTAVLRIFDGAPSVGFTAENYTVREGAASAALTVQLIGANATPVVVPYTTSNGTATAGGDYVATSATLTFPPGGTPTSIRTRTFTIPIVQDTVAEDPETFTVTLGAPSGADLIGDRTEATVTIVDNDPGGTIQFSSAVYTVSEGVGTLDITVTRSGSAGGATVDFTISDGSATTAGADYSAVAMSGTLIFNQGDRVKTLSVTINDDALEEGVETINLALSNPFPTTTTKLGRANAVIRIVDDELALGFSAANYTVKESGGSATITVELTGVNVSPVTVGFATSDGTATATEDYTTRTGTLTFAPGGGPTAVRTRTFTVPILRDALVEVAETVHLTLSGLVGATLVTGRDVATLFITDDDVGGVVQLSKDVFAATECAVTALTCTAKVTVSRTGGSAEDVTVDFATADGTATAGVDYTATTGTVTFGPGQMTQTITIDLLREVGVQPVKSFSVIISNPGGGGSLGPRTTAEVRITDPR
jgi:Calx-beta domain/Beta-propeller repeat